MPLTFLKQPTSFGQSFGQGLAGNLQRLAANRLQQIETQNEQNDFARKLMGAYNYSPEEASFIAAQPKEQRLKYLEQAPKPEGVQAQQQPSFEQEPTIAGAAEQQRAQELAPQQKQELTTSDAQQLLQQTQAQQFAIPGNDELAKVVQNSGIQLGPEQQAKLQQKLEAIRQNPELQKQYQQEYQNDLAQNKTLELRQPGSTAPAVPYEQLANAESRRFQKPLSAAEKLAAQKHQESLIADSFKMSQAERKEINDAGDAAEETRSHIKDLADLFKSGKLDTPGAMALLKDSGWPVDALQNPESAQAQNIIKSFLAGGPKLFGGKVSEGEMNVLLSAIPTLDTNPRGALLMLETMDKYAARAEVKQKALKEMIRENGGKVPYNWREELPDKLRPKYKQLEDRYKNNIKKIGELKLNEEAFAETVLQKIYGEAIGAIGSSAKKAASAFGTASGGALAGAAVGSLVPGIGTAAGATAGGLIGGIGGLASDLLKR